MKNEKLLSHLKQPGIFQNAKFRAKLKILEIGTKLAFGEQFSKTIVIFEISTLRFVNMQSFMQIIWVFLVRILKKTIAVFDVSTLEFAR